MVLCRFFSHKKTFETGTKPPHLAEGLFFHRSDRPSQSSTAVKTYPDCSQNQFMLEKTLDTKIHARLGSFPFCGFSRTDCVLSYVWNCKTSRVESDVGSCGPVVSIVSSLVSASCDTEMSLMSSFFPKGERSPG